MSLKRKTFNIFAAAVMIFGSIPTTFLSVHAEGETSSSDAPQHSKTVTSNGDGTYNITLSVTGKQESSTDVSKANVVIVFDTSNSMEYGTSCTVDNYYTNNDTDQYGYISSDQTYRPLYRYYGDWVHDTNHVPYYGTHYNCVSDRLTVAKNATTDLISKLLANNSLEGADNDTVEISLVNFATSVRSTTSWSTNETTLKNTVNGYNVPNNIQGGTNWETALSAAKTLVDNRISNQPKESNYVIFVSDGDPTFRDSRMGASGPNNDWNNEAGKWGTGSSDPHSWNYNAAKAVADTIAASSNTKLYAVGAFGNVTNMQNLAGSSNYYEASNQQALENAFKQIVDQITNALSLTHVKFTDGITALTTAAVSGNPDNFTYTKGGTAWADAPEAEIKTIDGVKTVVWDLGDTTLKDGETATVSFTVWPSQESYDLLADLNNGKKKYSDLTDDQKASIVENDGVYSLQTNTEWPTLTYSTVETVTVNGVPTTTVSDPITIEIRNDGPMPLDVRKLTLEKKWEDDLDPSQREEVNGEVVLNFYKDKNPYEEDIKLTEENHWKLENYIAIAPGVMISNDSSNYDTLKAGHTEYSFGGKKYIILETGHDYYFEEEDINSHFELTNYIYHPMVVDNTLMNVFFTRDADDKITGIEEFRVMESVSATNTLKGGINIQKKVVDKENKVVNTKDSFEVTAHLIDADGKPYKYDYRIYYGENNPEYESHIVYKTDENGEYVLDEDGNKIILYSRSDHIYATDETAGEFTETIYVGDTIRIVNVDSGVQYYVEEAAKDGYEAKPTIVYEEAYGTEDSEDAEQTDDGYYVVSGNTASSATVINKFLNAKTEVDFEKTWYGEDGNVLSGKDLPGSVTIELFKKGADGKKVSTGKTKTISSETDWKGSFTDLPKYDNGVEIVYSIEESAIKDAETREGYDGYFFEFDSEENNGQHAVVGRWQVATLEDFIVKNTWKPASDTVSGHTSFNIVKIDKNTKEVLSGATFELKLKDGTTFTATTDANGEATFDYLGAGEYTLKETNAPNDYELISAEPNVIIEIAGRKLTNVNINRLENTYEYIFSLTASQVSGYQYDTNSRTFTVENEPIPYIDITAAKVWDDDNDRDGLRKNYANYYIAVRNNSGKYVGYQKLVLVNKDNYKFPHLPTKTVNGDDITYEIVEASACSGSGNSIQCTEFDEDDDYTATVSNGVVTNYHKPALYGDLTVQKIWNDGNNELVRPTTITVELYGEITNDEGEKETWMEGSKEISSANEWKWTFKNLYKYKNGKEITYSVQESKLGNTAFGEEESTIIIYASDGAIEGSWTKSVNNETFEVTNTWKEAEDEIIYNGESAFTIKKIDKDGKALSDVVFAVEGHSDKITDKNGEISITVPITKTKKTENFKYVISEKEAKEGYDPVDGSATVTISCTSKLTDKDTDELINTYTKTCVFSEEGDDGFDWKESNLTLIVVNNRSMAKSLTIKKTVKGLSAEVLADLEFTIEGPEDFGEDGKMTLVVKDDCSIEGEIITCELEGEVPTGEYTVTESNADVEYFELKISGDNGKEKKVNANERAEFKITNKYEVEKTWYKVVKVWQDEHDKDGIRPTELEVNLLANGEPIQTKKLSAKNETQDDFGEDLEKSDVWEWTFEDLPVADENAEVIEYYAEEILEADGYEQIDEIGGMHTVIFVNMHEPVVDPCEEGGCGGEVPPVKTPETGKLTKSHNNDAVEGAWTGNMIGGAMMVILGISLVAFGKRKGVKLTK